MDNGEDSKENGSSDSIITEERVTMENEDIKTGSNDELNGNLNIVVKRELLENEAINTNTNGTSVVDRVTMEDGDFNTVTNGNRNVDVNIIEENLLMQNRFVNAINNQGGADADMNIKDENMQIKNEDITMDFNKETIAVGASEDSLIIESPSNLHILGTGISVSSENLADVKGIAVKPEEIIYNALNRSTESESNDESETTDEDVDLEIGNELDYACKRCKKEFSTLIGLKAHSITCRKGVSKFTKLKTYSKKSIGKNLSHGQVFYCEICNRDYSKEYYLNKHRQMKHSINIDDGMYKCNVCFKTFSLASSLTNHQQLHVENVCPTCGKVFETPSKLKAHKRIHTNDRPYSCDICKKKFRQLSHLTRHCMVHTGDTPFKCNICGKAYRDKYFLKEHVINVHRFSDRTFSCSVCEKRFSRQNNLDKHQLIHNEQKPFKCSQCTKTFKHPSAHYRHEKRHETSELACETCKEKVTCKKELMNHIGRHAKEASMFKQNIFKNFMGILDLKKIKQEGSGNSAEVNVKIEPQEVESAKVVD